jgi:hypothetical protein
MAAIAVLVANDHWAKDRWPGAVTGKLSDLVGMFLAPIVVAASWELARRRLLAVPTFIRLGLALAAAFVLLKTVGPVAEATGRVVAVVRSPDDWVACLPGGAGCEPDSTIVADPTDALAVVALAPAIGLWARRRPPQTGVRSTFRTMQLTGSAD